VVTTIPEDGIHPRPYGAAAWSARPPDPIATELYARSTGKSPLTPGAVSPVAVTIRLPVPTSTEAATRSPSWNGSVVAFLRAPAPSSGCTRLVCSADGAEQVEASHAATCHCTRCPAGSAGSVSRAVAPEATVTFVPFTRSQVLAPARLAKN
jgi:hypothetical protein